LNEFELLRLFEHHIHDDQILDLFLELLKRKEFYITSRETLMVVLKHDCQPVVKMYRNNLEELFRIIRTGNSS